MKPMHSLHNFVSVQAIIRQKPFELFLFILTPTDTLHGQLLLNAFSSPISSPNKGLLKCICSNSKMNIISFVEIWFCETVLLHTWKLFVPSGTKCIPFNIISTKCMKCGRRKWMKKTALKSKMYAAVCQSTGFFSVKTSTFYEYHIHK